MYSVEKTVESDKQDEIKKKSFIGNISWSTVAKTIHIKNTHTHTHKIIYYLRRAIKISRGRYS